MRYLKPNFSHHPLNYIFVLLIGFGAFSFTSLAHSFEDDGSYQSGYVYWLNHTGSVKTKFATATQSYNAQSYPTSYRFHFDGISWRVQYKNHFGVWANKYTVTKTSCSAYVNPPSACSEVPTPPNNCPESGVVTRIATQLNGEVVDGVYYPAQQAGGTTLTIGGSIVAQGCVYARSTDPSFDKDYDVKSYKSGVVVKFENMISTHEVGVASLDDPTSIAVASEVLPPESESSKSQLETTSDKVVGDVTVTDMAGVSSATQTTTETLVKEKGAVVVDSQETAVVTVSDGIYRTVTTTVNTLDFPDGTQQVITETNTAYTQTPKTVFNIDKSTGNTSITVQNGSSADYSVTETKDYDADGNETGSKSEESGSGDGEAEEEKEAEECKADPEKCKEAEFAKTEKGSFDLLVAATAMGDAEGEYKEYLEIVKGEVQEKIGIQFSGGSGSIDSNVINVRGATGDIGLTKWIPFLDDFGLAALILFLAAVYSAYILLGGNRD